MVKRNAQPKKSRWMELDRITKELALAELDRFIERGDTEPGAMAVESMQLAFTQLSWQIVRWVDESLKEREKKASPSRRTRS